LNNNDVEVNYQQFDGKGNIITINDSLNGITHSYTYDSLDRLLTANGVGTNPYNQSYQYDRIGNIILKSDVGTYSYGDYSVRPHAVQSAGPFTFTYDANGNMTSRTGGGDSISIPSDKWNYDNKPTQIQRGATTITLTYDGNGQRVKKQSSVSGTTLYFGELYEVRGGAGTIHLFAGNRRVASVFSDGRTQFYHTNHLGSASVITDQNGVKKEKIEYFPFGTYREAIDYDTNFPDVFYTFTGQEDDDDLGFYNFKARLYDPALGRFISPDSLVPNPEDPQSLNRYSYGRNNPINYIDPNGRFFIWWHLFDQFIASLYCGRGLYTFKDVWDNLMVDIRVRDPNAHALAKWDYDKGRYQTIEEAMAGAKKYIEGVEPGAGGHTIQDSGAGSHGFKLNPEGFLENVWHTIKEILFPNPIEIWKSLKDTIDFMKDQEGTINKFFEPSQVSIGTTELSQIFTGSSDSSQGFFGLFDPSQRSYSFFNSSQSFYRPVDPSQSSSIFFDSSQNSYIYYNSYQTWGEYW
jgi:RHS repeat-associated protein